MNNDSTIGTQSEEKPKKMTRAEFIVAFDEMNAEIQKNIAEVRESQARNKVLREETNQSIVETRRIIEAL